MKISVIGVPNQMTLQPLIRWIGEVAVLRVGFLIVCLMLSAVFMTKNCFADEVSAPVEYRQIHPDARKNLVDEITIQIKESTLSWLGDAARVIAAAVTLIAVILGFAGWRSLKGFKESTRLDMQRFILTDDNFLSDVKREVERAVSQSGAVTYERARREYNLGRLELSAKDVESKEGFSTDERDLLFDLLMDVGSDPIVSKTASFKNTLKKVVLSFAGAGIGYHIDLLDKRFRDTFRSSHEILIILIQHYGMRALGDVNPNDETFERFAFYCQACRASQLSEFALPYEMVFLNIQNSEISRSEIEEKFVETKYLNESDLGTFLSVLRDKSNADKFVTAMQERTQKKFRAFVDAYHAKLVELATKLSSMEDPLGQNK